MKRWWCLLLLFAMLLRVGAASFWEFRFIPSRVDSSIPRNGDGPFFFGDSDSYWKLSRSIASGQPYRFDEKRHWTVFRMPGYPLLLAPLFILGGDSPPVFPARLLNCMLGTLAVALVGLLAFRLFRNERTAFLAALFAAVDPCSILQSVVVLSEAGFSVFMLLQLILFVSLFEMCGLICPAQAEETRSDPASLPWKLGIYSGLAWAAAVYFRPSWLYFAPMLFLLLFAALLIKATLFSSAGRKIFLTAAVTTMTFALAMSPWWVRNAMVTGRFVPTTLQLGASLYDGLNPEADGSSNMAFIDRFRDEERASPCHGSEHEHFEVRLDRRMKQASLDWCRTHTGEVARLAKVKFFRLWNIVPNEASFSSRTVRAMIVISYVPILFFAAVGLIHCRKRWGLCILLIAPALYITLLHIIFVSSLRYRTPAMFALMVLAASVIVRWAENYKFRSVNQTANPDSRPCPEQTDEENG